MRISILRSHCVLLVALLWLVLPISLAAAQTQPSVAFDVEGLRADPVAAGHTTIKWIPDPIMEDENEIVYFYQLQSATDEAFTDAVLRYDGTRRQFFISGLTDGEHYFRIRLTRDLESEPWSKWSETYVVPVAHHPLWKAWTFFGVGLFLFVAIVAFVVTNAVGRGTGDE